jgi:predicted transposase/invertase (TIGR01784 family)
MAKKATSVIRFDWAMKKMLRDKANFDILEGFLSELLHQDIKIKQILESESNQEKKNDKHNRVDIFVENEKGELMIIEVQNSQEYDYFHRILFGTSKAITEHIKRKEPYSQVKKIISITIAYFDLGQGEDYIYHGTTNFVGIHKKDKLELALKQKDIYKVDTPADIYPEYWLIKVENFNDRIKHPVDEWVYMFKNAAVRDGFSAKGIEAAKERLKETLLEGQEREDYRRYLRSLHDLASEEYNKNIAFQEALEKAVKEEVEKAVKEEVEKAVKEEVEKAVKEEVEKAADKMILEMQEAGISTRQIAKITHKTEAEITQILERLKQN